MYIAWIHYFTTWGVLTISHTQAEIISQGVHKTLKLCKVDEPTCMYHVPPSKCPWVLEIHDTKKGWVAYMEKPFVHITYMRKP